MQKKKNINKLKQYLKCKSFYLLDGFEINWLKCKCNK